MSSVTVMGGITTEGGLKESMAVQRRHNGQVAEALLNISGVGTITGAPVHKDDPRPQYVHQEYPALLYKPLPDERGWKEVRSADEMQEALSSGWRLKPYPHIQIAVLDEKQEKKNLLDTNDRLQAQLIQMQEQMDKMASLMDGKSKAK